MIQPLSTVERAWAELHFAHKPRTLLLALSGHHEAVRIVRNVKNLRPINA